MSVEAPPQLAPLLQNYIPREKSWDIRNYALDTRYGYTDMDRALDPAIHQLPTDLVSLHYTRQDIAAGKQQIRVGESGTIHRVFDHIGLALGQDWEFITEGTLTPRPKTRAIDTVGMTIPEMLRLDKGSSQHATGAVLAGNNEPMPIDAPYHLRMTYEAMAHWYQRRRAGELWLPRPDQTLTRQAASYVEWLTTDEMRFQPIQPEDYPFARVFGIMTPDDAVALGWGSLEGHESNRLESTEDAIGMVALGLPVPFADHRLLQALRMRHGQDAHFEHVEAISKSWPLIMFNAFLAEAKDLNSQNQALEP